MVLVLGIVRASLEILGIGIGVKKVVLLRYGYNTVIIKSCKSNITVPDYSFITNQRLWSVGSLLKGTGVGVTFAFRELCVVSLFQLVINKRARIVGHHTKEAIS